MIPSSPSSPSAASSGAAADVLKPEQAYFAFLAQGRFMIQRSRSSGELSSCGTCMPTCWARSSTASLNFMPAFSIRNLMASPWAPHPKQW